ncbi:4'-phosphopantetheinyl transferase superfamily protein [Streptomyces sp. M10(2022)]
MAEFTAATRGRGSAQPLAGTAGPLRTEVAALAGSVLDGAEKERAARLRRQEDRESYLAAHVGLRLLLGAYLGTLPPECRCTGCRAHRAAGRTDARGARRSGALLALARRRALPAGLRRDHDRCGRGAGSCSRRRRGTRGGPAPRECAEVLALPPALRARAFTRLWTRKEAYLKGLGTGLNRLPSLDCLGGTAEGPSPRRRAGRWPTSPSTTATRPPWPTAAEPGILRLRSSARSSPTGRLRTGWPGVGRSDGDCFRAARFSSFRAGGR